VLFVLFWASALYGEQKKMGKIGMSSWLGFAIDLVLFVLFFRYLHGYGELCGKYHYYKWTYPAGSDLEDLFDL
jgi:hypothetical protein